jgi:cell division protease FtsH
MEKETLSKEDMARICAPVTKRPSLAPYNGFGKRTPSDQPPVLTPGEVAAQNGGSVNGHVSGKTTPVGDVGAPAQR